MKNMVKAKWFVLGMVVSFTLFQMATPAMAALTGKWIEVFTGVSIYVDDAKLNPTDGNGNTVEPFVYNGTAYLPVRAVSEAVGKTVQWDAKAQSVFLGKHESDTPAIYLADMDWLTGRNLKNEAIKDNLGNIHQQAINQGIHNTYMLNGQYSKITGTLFWEYQYRNYDAKYNLKIYGDDKLLYSAQITKETFPTDFEVDLTGVLKLEVELNRLDKYYDILGAAIADFALWT